MEQAQRKSGRNRFDIGYELGFSHALEETLKRLKLNLWNREDS